MPNQAIPVWKSLRKNLSKQELAYWEWVALKNPFQYTSILSPDIVFNIRASGFGAHPKLCIIPYKLQQ